jgi:putative transposase
MGVKRYELDEAQWLRIAPLLPGKASDPERTGSDNRLFVNGVLWVLRSGAHWQDLPERYGKWKTAHKRFSRWAMISSASDMIRSISSLTVGMSWIRPATWPQDQPPASIWPSTMTLG